MIDLLKKISKPWPRSCQWQTPLSARSGRRAASSALAALATLAASLTLLAPGTASAQTVSNPPLLPQDVTVFPQRDFTSIAGFAPNADVLVQVRRAGVVSSDALGRTDASGFVEVNHPGGVCWRNVTPDIVPADVVRVTYRNTPHNVLNNPTVVIGSGAAITTQNVTATQAVIAGDTVVIKGKAQLANGSRMALSRLEVRIVNPEFIGAPGSRIGKRDIRADSAGGRVDGVGGNPIAGTRGTDRKSVV